MGNGTGFRKKLALTQAAPMKRIVRRTSPATPETGSAAIKICRPRSNAARSKTIRSSGGFRRNSKPGCKTGCSIFPACLRSSRNACSTAWKPGST